MKLVCLLASSLTVLATATDASAAPPSWCAVPDAPQIPHHLGLDDALDDKEVLSARVKSIAGILCKDQYEARDNAPALEAARQKVGKALGMVDADWADARAYTGAETSDAFAISFRDTGGDPFFDHPKIAWSAFGPLDQFAAITRGYSMNIASEIFEKMYLADAFGARLSETGRLAFVKMNCLKNKMTAGDYAVCKPDVDALDFDKIATEIRADKTYTGAQRMVARLEMAKVRDHLPAFHAGMKKMAARDEGYAKAFALGDAQRTAWTKLWATETALLDIAVAMEDVRATKSRKAIAGCEDKTWEAWKAAVSRIPASAFEGLSDELQDPLAEQVVGAITSTPHGYLAAVAYALCREEKPDALTSTIGGVINYQPGLRGPRTATVMEILRAGIVLDDATAKLEVPTVRRTFPAQTVNGVRLGTLGAVKAQGATATITYAKKLEKQQRCSKYRESKRPTYIRGDGSLVYERTCLAYGTVMSDETPVPATAATRFTEGLKPGMYVGVAGDLVVLAYKKGAKAPSFVTGVAVK